MPELQTSFCRLARDQGLTALHKAARVHVLPCIAGQNGADNMAVLLPGGICGCDGLASRQRLLSSFGNALASAI